MFLGFSGNNVYESIFTIRNANHKNFVSSAICSLSGIVGRGEREREENYRLNDERYDKVGRGDVRKREIQTKERIKKYICIL